MSRQQATPVLLPNLGAPVRLEQLSSGVGGHGLSELDIQKLIQANPECLPITEIDPLFRNPVPICIELQTPAGYIDNLMVTPSGLPILIECKLWKNPQARREVVGQILDYAKELSRWTSSDLQREASKCLKRSGNAILDMVREQGHVVDESEFNDALSLNLRRGRFLLLIVGDGIHEGVEAIAEYLQRHAGLHFTLGLVEMPVFVLPDGSKLVVPRVLARTEKIVRVVVELPAEMKLADEISQADEDEEGPPLSEEERTKNELSRERRRQERLQFWTDFLRDLKLDDPDQPIAKAARKGNISFILPVPGGSCWLTVYRDKTKGAIGLFLGMNKGSIGSDVARALSDDAQALREELGPTARLQFGEYEIDIGDSRPLKSFGPSAERDEAFVWLRERTNTYVNALRPRLKAAAERLGE